MIKSRFMHSCCVLGDKIYAVGGRDPRGQPLSEIEMIEGSNPVEWTLIEIQHAVERVRPMVAPLGPNQILIFGCGERLDIET